MSLLKPTESELEILQVLWDKKSATVRQVHETLAINKDVRYTTTLKLMQIMTEKGLVKRDVSNKIHLYTPIVSAQKIKQSMVSKMIDNVFEGSASKLVIQALGNNKTSNEEIAEIRKFLDQLSESNGKNIQ